MFAELWLMTIAYGWVWQHPSLVRLSILAFLALC